MSDPTQRLIQYAEECLGLSELAKRLQTSEHLIVAWKVGKAGMPNKQKLVLADLIDELNSSPKDSR
jgi:hypothetical protein